MRSGSIWIENSKASRENQMKWIGEEKPQKERGEIERNEENKQNIMYRSELWQCVGVSVTDLLFTCVSLPQKQYITTKHIGKNFFLETGGIKRLNESRNDEID